MGIHVLIGIRRHVLRSDVMDFARHTANMVLHIALIRTTTLIGDNGRDHLHQDDHTHHNVHHDNKQIVIHPYHHTDEPVHQEEDTKALEDNSLQDNTIHNIAQTPISQSTPELQDQPSLVITKPQTLLQTQISAKLDR